MKILIAMIASCLAAVAAQAANIEYRMLTNGDASSSQTLPAGQYGLDIEVRVTDNLIGPNSDIVAGLFQSAIDLTESAHSLEFFNRDCGFGPVCIDWGSSTNPVFTTFFRGLIDQSTYEVFAQTGSIPPSNFNVSTAKAVGAGIWTNVFSGEFNYNGFTTELSLEAELRNHLLPAFDSGVVGRVPLAPGDSISGYSIELIGVPQPPPHSIRGNLRTVAFTDDIAPGTDEGFTFGEHFGVPVINESGLTAFDGQLTGLGADESNRRSLYMEAGGGGLVQVARQLDLVPGFDRVVFIGSLRSVILSSVILNDNHDVVFHSSLVGEGVDASNNTGVFIKRIAEPLTLIARESREPGSRRGFLGIPLLNNRGQVAVINATACDVSQPCDYQFIVTEEHTGDQELVSRSGMGLPGEDTVFTDNSHSSNSRLGRTINDHGSVAFVDNGVLFSGTPGKPLQVIASVGDVAPGIGTAEFRSLFPTNSNNLGQTVIFGSLTGPEVNASNDGALFLHEVGEGLKLIMREGDAIPELGSGVNFRGGFTGIINGSGQISILASLTGNGVDSSNDRALFVDRGRDGLDLIARTGDSVPGLSEEVSFRSLGENVINGQGQIALTFPRI